ncbi:MAG: helix-turn-helix transcriptional regulator [Candidatus Latescibacteria bacterium]|jgi:HTH-type transcriptional regulator / antitoxin HipB|nr:helix-turn-helix transcriptional regulator [Candidatus Latescibacterota bacterium]
MKTFRKHLNEKLKDKQFKKLYEEERQLAALSLKILGTREQRGLSQKDVAQKANVTQQQLSKVENGINCNLTTFLKVCNALDLKIDLDPLDAQRALEKA